MGNLGVALGSLGILGMIGSIIIGFLVLLILPIWSIFDCGYSKREGGIKTLIIILLFLSWGVGSLIYSIFFASSKALRMFSIFSICGFVLLFIFSLSSFVGGAKISREVEQERQQIEETKLISDFNPKTIDVSSISGFKAIHFTHQEQYHFSSASIADFTIGGSSTGNAIPIKSNTNDAAKHITYDENKNIYYGITTHNFGEIHPSSGNFKYIEVSPSNLKAQFSWPKGIAYNSKNQEIAVLASRRSLLFFYNPELDEWRTLEYKLPPFSNIEALAYNPMDNVYYMLNLGHNAKTINNIFIINSNGANVGEIQITPKIPIGKATISANYFQLKYVSGKIILIVPPFRNSSDSQLKEWRIFAIDPKNGQVFVAEK